MTPSINLAMGASWDIRNRESAQADPKLAESKLSSEVRAVRHPRMVAILFVVLQTFSACTAAEQTPGERFEKFIKTWSKKCENLKLSPGETTCDILKLKAADPLATPEGRFAHSIKIPNPLPADSGYKPGMSPQRYFEHLCRTEAGEFVYKTVKDVNGIHMMRPRIVRPYEPNHLYASENPFVLTDDAKALTPWRLVRPGRFGFAETQANFVIARSENGDQSIFEQPASPIETISRFWGYDGKSLLSMRKSLVKQGLSEYGYTWRGIERPKDRALGVAGGEIIVLNLRSGEVVAVKRGFAKFEFLDERYGIASFQWRKRCPNEPRELADRESNFLLKVLRSDVNR
jgi:hypothetical protein